MDLHEISKDEENFQKFIIDKYEQFCKEDEISPTDSESIEKYLNHEFYSADNNSSLEGYKAYIPKLDVFTEEDITFDSDVRKWTNSLSCNYEENVIRKNLGLELKDLDIDEEEFNKFVENYQNPSNYTEEEEEL